LSKRRTSLSGSIPADLDKTLRSEYSRLQGLQRGCSTNPGPVTWDTFLALCLALGLERLRQLSPEEALNRMENEALMRVER
jgi:ADP-ribosylglycohydrolase